ncbi:MAG: alpha/beta hydrolase [Chitinophagaceae bacterium]|nr:alpha/beta hydrolase [Chitinophagaceae bacterium]
MFIETIHTKPSSAPKATIVLLHGVCFGAWYWENNFQPWFTAKGYDVIAISYRNHGNSEQKGSLKWRTINEYVEDVHSVVSKIDGTVYLIGHSMGGFIVQHYLQKHPSANIKKAVLLCTVPASGIGGATWQVIKAYPFSFLKALFTFSFAPVFNAKTKAKKLMFAPEVKDELIDAVVPRMQDESFRAYLDMMLLNLPKAKQPGIPLLIIGGEDDYLINKKALVKNTKQLGAELVMMRGGHNINLEEGWENVAERVEFFFSAEK